MKPTRLHTASIVLCFAALSGAQAATTAITPPDSIRIAQMENNQGGPKNGFPGNQGGSGMGQGGGQQQRRGPPPQAIDACKGKASGAVCSFTSRNGEALNGTCFTPPAGGQGAANSSGATGAPGTHPIACRPDRGGQNGMPPGQQRSPNAGQGVKG